MFSRHLHRDHRRAAPSMNYVRNGKSYDVFASSLGSEAPAARKRFHERLQTLFRFAIETSSAIDGSDERWRVLTIYERDAGGAAPSRRRVHLGPLPAVARRQRLVKLLRICQVTTLPPFRKQGHGAKLLLAVYEYAKSVDALEVTVEDPNETFRLVRDKVDLQNGRKYIESHPHKEEPSALITERKALKLTEEQMARVSEMRTLQTLRASGKTSADDSEMKSFRLLVKKRLSRKHKEELDAMLSLQKRQKEQEDAEGGGGGGESSNAAAAANDGPPTPSKEELVAMKKELAGGSGRSCSQSTRWRSRGKGFLYCRAQVKLRLTALLFFVCILCVAIETLIFLKAYVSRLEAAQEGLAPLQPLPYRQVVRELGPNSSPSIILGRPKSDVEIRWSVTRSSAKLYVRMRSERVPPVSTSARIALFSSLRFSASCASIRAARIRIADARFWCCERSFWQLTLMPVGLCVMRTALSVVLTCCPPAPPARKVSTTRSASLISSLPPLPLPLPLSSAAGSTMTDAVDVCTRPKLSVAGTRCTRCTPLSARSMP